MATIIPFRLSRENSRPGVPSSGQRATVIRFPGAEPAPVSVPAPVRRTRGSTKEDDQRKAMLGKVHIAKKDLMRLPGFNDDTYRFILEHNFGVSSAAELSNAQLHGLLIHFASLGWQAKKGRHRKEAPRALTHDATGMSREAHSLGDAVSAPAPGASGAGGSGFAAAASVSRRLRKIEAMLAEKGRAEGTDVPWGYAVAILKRQTANEPAGQVRSFDKAGPRQLDDVIAALYRDARRKGRRRR